MDAAVNRWESYVEFEAPVPIDRESLDRLGEAIAHRQHIEKATPSSVNRGTGHAIAGTIVATAADAGTALNTAISTFIDACRAAAIDHTFFREGTVRPADLDPR